MKRYYSHVLALKSTKHSLYVAISHIRLPLLSGRPVTHPEKVPESMQAEIVQRCFWDTLRHN